MTLRARLVALVAISTLLTAATVGLAAALIVNRSLQEQIDRALTERIEGLVGRSLVVTEQGAVVQLTPALVRRELRISSAAERLIGDEGPRILLDFVIGGVHVPDQGVTKDVITDFGDDDDMAFLAPSFQTTSSNEGPVRVATARIGDVQYVRAMRTLSDVRQIASSFGFSLAAWGVLIAMASALVTALIVGRALTPLRRLARAAQRVAQTQDLRDTGLRDTASSRLDEIGELASSMAQMSDALALSRDQQRQLVDDVAHEMRTPLTSIRANVELLRRQNSSKALNESATQEALADVASEVAELDLLIGEVAELATPEDLPSEPDVEIDLSHLVGEVVEKSTRRSGRQIDLIDRTESGTTVLGPEKGIERALGNLLGNALKFAPSGPIAVVLEPEGVFVDDAGDGIPEADRSNVSKRFWRSSKARGLPGSGLGLAIADRVARQLDGELIVNVSEFGGARVGVLWSAKRVNKPNTTSPKRA